MDKNYNLPPNIIESLRRRVQFGEITIYGAAVEFARSGWDNFVDEKSTRERLGTVRPKTYYIAHNVGRVKYLLCFHDGISGCKDGSPAYGIACFSNKAKLTERIKQLEAEGYFRER